MPAAKEEKQIDTRRRLTLAEWMAEGTALFGPDQFEWKFVCPVCGNVAGVKDFKAHKDKGARPSSAYQECIGRYTGADGFKDKGKGPCNYAGYGLFRLSPLLVSNEGHETHSFDFARK